MKLPPRPEPLVTPPNTRAWKGTKDAGGQGLRAARTVEGEYNYVDRPSYIVKAVSMAPMVVAALTLFVLHAPTKLLVVSAQIELGNSNRTYALLSEGSILRAIVAVSLSTTVMVECDALHRLLGAIWEGMKIVKPAPGKPSISKGKAVQTAFSVILRFAETIFKSDPNAFAVVEAVRNVLGCTALCSFAALNASYHSGEALQKLEDFWKALNAASSKDVVVSIFGASFKMCQNGAVPMLMISQCGWCPETGWPVFAAAACLVSYPEITMTGMARLVVSSLHRFLVYCRMIHCGLSGQKPAGVDVTQYLLDLALRIPYMCVDKLFGLNGHTNVNLGSTVCMVPLLGASDERDFLMGAGVGVFGTLPLLDRKVFRAIFDLLKRAPFITGDHGIYKAMFGQEQKWVPGPLWK